MKLRVKSKAVKNLNVAFTEADEKILHMFGNGWLDENFKNKESQNSGGLPSLANDDDLQAYLDDPYEIEEVVDDNFQSASQSSQDFSSSEQTLSGRDMSTFGSILRGQSSHGQSLRGQSLRGQSSRGQSSRGQSSRGGSSRGQSSQGQSSHGQSSRGQSSRGRGHLSRGLSTRGNSFRGQPQRGTINGPKIRVCGRPLMTSAFSGREVSRTSDGL